MLKLPIDKITPKNTTIMNENKKGDPKGSPFIYDLIKMNLI